MPIEPLQAARQRSRHRRPRALDRRASSTTTRSRAFFERADVVVAAVPADRSVGRAFHGARVRQAAAAHARRRLQRDRRSITERRSPVEPDDLTAIAHGLNDAARRRDERAELARHAGSARRRRVRLVARSPERTLDLYASSSDACLRDNRCADDAPHSKSSSGSVRRTARLRAVRLPAAGRAASRRPALAGAGARRRRSAQRHADHRRLHRGHR